MKDEIMLRRLFLKVAGFGLSLISYVGFASKAKASKYGTGISRTAESMGLFVDFIRNREDFKVNQYCQRVPVSAICGIWYQILFDQFSELAFRCRRRVYSDSGHFAGDEENRRVRSLAQKAMTCRTMSVIQKITDVDQYATRHVADLRNGNTLEVKGNWEMSTTGRMDIRSSLSMAKNVIWQDTQGAVKAEQLSMLMGVDTACSVFASQEMSSYLQDHPEVKTTTLASGQVIPMNLYGIKVIIEETVSVAKEYGLSVPVARFVMPFGTVVILHRPEEPEGIEGGRSYATVSLHCSDEFTVESTEGQVAVIDNYDVNMTCPVSGFLFLNVC
jgi:hypothetical protein